MTAEEVPDVQPPSLHQLSSHTSPLPRGSATHDHDQITGVLIEDRLLDSGREWQYSIFSPTHPPDDENDDEFTHPFSLGLAVSNTCSPRAEPINPLTEPMEYMLLSSYLDGSGSWVEVTDSSQHFTVGSIHALLKHRVCHAAIMAFASRQIDLVNCRSCELTLQLYQYTVQLFLQYVHEVEDQLIIAACALLCSYEMVEHHPLVQNVW